MQHASTTAALLELSPRAAGAWLVPASLGPISDERGRCIGIEAALPQKVSMKLHAADGCADQKIVPLRLVDFGLERAHLRIRVVLVGERHDGDQRTTSFLIFEQFRPDRMPEVRAVDAGSRGSTDGSSAR